MTAYKITASQQLINGRKHSFKILEGEILKNRYQLYEDQLISDTSNSIIRKAYDIERSQDVAIKEVRVKGAKSWKPLEFIEREGKALESLDHQNVVKFVDKFVEGASAYLVTEFIEGKTLAKLKEEKFSFLDEEIDHIVGGLLDALIYLHSQNPKIIHRDIKPENIIHKEDGTIVLVDFGFVKVLESTGTSAYGLNSIGFTAPELILGENGSTRSDIFSAGALYLWLKTGQSAFDIKSEDDITKYEYPIDLDEKAKKIIERSVVFDQRKRFGTVLEMKQVLLGTTSTALMKASLTTLTTNQLQERMIQLREEIVLRKKKFIKRATTMVAGGLVASITAYSIFGDVLSLAPLFLSVLIISFSTPYPIYEEVARNSFEKLHTTNIPLKRRIREVMSEIIDKVALMDGKKNWDLKQIHPIDEFINNRKQNMELMLPLDSKENVAAFWSEILGVYKIVRSDKKEIDKSDKIKVYEFLLEALKIFVSDPQNIKFLRQYAYEGNELS